MSYGNEVDEAKNCRMDLSGAGAVAVAGAGEESQDSRLTGSHSGPISLLLTWRLPRSKLVVSNYVIRLFLENHGKQTYSHQISVGKCAHSLPPWELMCFGDWSSYMGRCDLMKDMWLQI